MTMTTPSTAFEPDRPEKVVKKHPIRGAIWGLVLGLGLAIYLVIFAVVPFGDWLVLGLVVVLAFGLGVVWAYLAPAKAPKEAPPEPPPAPEGIDDTRDITPTATGRPDDLVIPDDLDELPPPPLPPPTAAPDGEQPPDDATR